MIWVAGFHTGFKVEGENKNGIVDVEDKHTHRSGTGGHAQPKIFLEN